MLKYLKSTASSGTLNTGSIGDLVARATNFVNVITISNVATSGNSISGALIVSGGTGIGGNLNVGGNVGVAGNLTALNGRFTNNLTVLGYTTSSYVVVPGRINATTGVINFFYANTVNTTGTTVTDSLQVNNAATFDSVSSRLGSFSSLTSGSISGVNTLTASTVQAGTLYVDAVYPNNDTQINLGDPSKIKITGGIANQVLGTDGNGNLSWIQGPAGLSYGTGLTRVGDVVSLAGTGFAAGTYNLVTIDQYGRVVSGSRSTENLELITSRGSSTSQVINITNSADATDVNEGALIVTGGVGIGATLVADKIISKDSTTIEGTLTTSGSFNANRTVNFNAVNAGEVPFKITSGSLVSSPDQGSIEFDGDFLYIMTNSGRQVLQARSANLPASTSVLVQTIATRNIDVNNPHQTVNVYGDIVDCWDEVILLQYDKVLLTQQTDPTENGIYIWQGAGQALIRSSDFNALSGIQSGTLVYVAQGATYGGSFWQVSTDNPISVGSTAIQFARRISSDNIAIGNLPVNNTAGLITRTAYGAVALRQVKSGTSWITVANGTGKLGDITITGGTVPVASGGTGRTSITGWMKGVGGSIQSTATIPLSDIAGAGTMASQNANNVSITSGTISVTSATAGTATITGNLTAGNTTITGTTSINSLVANNLTVSNITVSGPVAVPGLLANAIQLGANSTGSLSTSAVSVSTTQNVTDTIALMNVILGKLVPPSPPNFPDGQTLTIASLSSARMCSFTQTDNTTTGGYTVSAGTTVTNIRRSSSYTTNTITGVGPGDTGTVKVYKNGAESGSRAMVGGQNGSNGDLTISNNQDYHNINSAVNSNFWYSYNAQAAGTGTAGWNDVKITHQGTGETNLASWYYDNSSPGTPAFSNSTITVDVSNLVYTSTIPHYTNNTRFDISFDINRLSGDTYPNSNTFITGSAGGAFGAPVSLTYSSAGITTPLTRNLYVSGGSVNLTTTANIISGFGSSSAGPTLSVNNGYNTGSNTFNPGATILYKTGTGTQIDETNIPVNSVGSGSGNAVRIVNPGSSDTPAYSASATAFDSQLGTLQNYDATVVAAILKHDQTNYSSGYLPQGPDLSSGRSGTQYFTFKFTRTVVSKFDVKYSGTLAGLWVALPGSSIDTTSTLNGWLTMTTAYNGSGVPGAGAGGNGSNGCAVGGVAVTGSAQTNKRVTATFGTVSSSGTATNEIYVRVKLTSGQSITALSIEAASN